MRRRWPLLAGAGLLLLLLGALVGAMLGGGSRARFPSSFAAEPEGLLAFRRLLAELGVPVEIALRPWPQELPDSAGVLVVATPLQRRVTREEKETLREWLVGGGALLVVDDATVVETSQHLDTLLSDAGLPRNAPATDPDLRSLKPSRPETAPVSGTSLPLAGADLAEIPLHAGGRFTGDFRGVPLALGRQGAPRAAAARVGRGWVVRVLGPLLARDHLLQGDSLEFALRLTETLRAGGPVRFDEFHHGYGGVLPRLEGPERSALVWAILQGLVAAIVFGAARGVRFGPARPHPPPQRRSSLEFVHSMASLYRRAGARRRMLQVLRDRFVRRVRGRWSLAADPDAETLATLLESRARIDAEETLRRIESDTGDPRLEERRMLARARDLERLEREVFGEIRDGA